MKVEDFNTAPYYWYALFNYYNNLAKALISKEWG